MMTRGRESNSNWSSKEIVNGSRAKPKVPDGESTKVPDYVPKWTSARYSLAFLGFLGFVNVYALRVNLSVAIISMINSTDDTSNTTQCSSQSNKSSSHHQGEFNWSSSEKALVLGSFFYGYICTQILGGFLASRFGGKYLFGGGVLCTTVFTFLTPLAARTSFALLIATRVVEGIGEGVTFPAMHAMWGVWAPPIERSKMVSFTYAGSQFGTIIAQPISGILSASDFLGGWPSVFYVFGTLGLLWCILWFIFAFNKPSEHPRISEIELAYIESVVPQEEQRHNNIPWFKILTSGPVWGITVAHFSNNWGFYTLLTCLPLYLKNVLGFDISQDGLVAALPYLVMWININVMGIVADTLRERGYLTTTQTRKVFNSIGLIGPAVFLVAAGFVGCNRLLAVVFICLGTTLNACVFSGYNSNHIDVASRYAGILMGISNTAATIPGFVTPIVVQALTGHHEDQLHWRTVFYIAAAIYIMGTVVYLILGTGKEQQWNRSCYLAEVDSVYDDAKPLLGDNKEHLPDGTKASSFCDELSS